MNHALIAPILIPLLTALGLLLLPDRLRRHARVLSSLSAVVQLAVAVFLVHTATAGELQVYTLGNWAPPYGIILVLDRLSALMVLLSAILAVACTGYSARHTSSARSLQSLMQFLLMGVNGAFLTGDLFNLFVFFEVLLLASYALLVFGGGADRTKAALHYVVLNLAGSALFLISVSVIYGVTGTLNMAHLAERVAELSAADQPLAGAAAAILLVVFGLKAGIVPLYFWLPQAYAKTDASVAALFAIMTKVGVYAIIRVYPLIFGDNAGSLAHFAADLLWPIGLLTIALGLIGALASREMHLLVAYLLVVSIGTLITGFSLRTEAAYAAGMFYLVQSTLVSAGFFLMTGLLARQRGGLKDQIRPGPSVPQPTLYALLFLLAGVSIAGLPPFAGFAGKVMLMQAAGSSASGAWFWALLLISSLAAVIALSRAGSTFFYKTTAPEQPVNKNDTYALACTLALLLLGPLLILFGRPAMHYTEQLAQQLTSPHSYINAVNATRAAADRTPEEVH